MNAADSLCIPHEDCLGTDCDVTVRQNLVRSRINVTLRVDPDHRTVKITSGGKTQHLNGDGEWINRKDSQLHRPIYRDWSIKISDWI